MSSNNSSKVFRVQMGENGEDPLWHDRTFTDFKEAYEFARQIIDDCPFGDWEIAEPINSEVASWERACDFLIIEKETA